MNIVSSFPNGTTYVVESDLNDEGSNHYVMKVVSVEGTTSFHHRYLSQCNLCSKVHQQCEAVVNEFFKQLLHSNMKGQQKPVDIIDINALSLNSGQPMPPMCMFSAAFSMLPFLRAVSSHVDKPHSSDSRKVSASYNFMYSFPQFSSLSVAVNPRVSPRLSSKLRDGYIATLTSILHSAPGSDNWRSQYMLSEYIQRSQQTRRGSTELSVSLWSEEMIWRMLNGLVACLAAVHSAGLHFNGNIVADDIICFSVAPNLMDDLCSAFRDAAHIHRSQTVSKKPLSDDEVLNVFLQESWPNIVLPNAYITPQTQPHHAYFCITSLPQSSNAGGEVAESSFYQRRDLDCIGQLISSILETRFGASNPPASPSSELQFIVKRMTNGVGDLSSAPSSAVHISQLQALRLRAETWLYKSIAEMFQNCFPSSFRDTDCSEWDAPGSMTSNPGTAVQRSLAQREQQIAEREKKLDTFLELYELTYEHLDSIPQRKRNPASGVPTSSVMLPETLRDQLHHRTSQLIGSTQPSSIDEHNGRANLLPHQDRPSSSLRTDIPVREHQDVPRPSSLNIDVSPLERAVDDSPSSNSFHQPAIDEGDAAIAAELMQRCLDIDPQVSLELPSPSRTSPPNDTMVASQTNSIKRGGPLEAGTHLPRATPNRGMVVEIDLDHHNTPILSESSPDARVTRSTEQANLVSVPRLPSSNLGNSGESPVHRSCTAGREETLATGFFGLSQSGIEEAVPLNRPSVERHTTRSLQQCSNTPDRLPLTSLASIHEHRDPQDALECTTKFVEASELTPSARQASRHAAIGATQELSPLTAPKRRTHDASSMETGMWIQQQYSTLAELRQAFDAATNSGSATSRSTGTSRVALERVSLDDQESKTISRVGGSRALGRGTRITSAAASAEGAMHRGEAAANRVRRLSGPPGTTNSAGQSPRNHPTHTERGEVGPTTPKSSSHASRAIAAKGGVEVGRGGLPSPGGRPENFRAERRPSGGANSERTPRPAAALSVGPTPASTRDHATAALRSLNAARMTTLSPIRNDEDHNAGATGVLPMGSNDSPPPEPGRVTPRPTSLSPGLWSSDRPINVAARGASPGSAKSPVVGGRSSNGSQGHTDVSPHATHDAEDAAAALLRQLRHNIVISPEI